ncbi:hypothetical protein AVM02_11045 [Brucella anthropi]
MRKSQAEHAWKDDNPPADETLRQPDPLHRIFKRRQAPGQRNYSPSRHVSAQTLFQKDRFTLVENYLGD